MPPKRISNLTSPTELKWFHKAGERGWRPLQRQSQHKLPFTAFPSELGPLHEEKSCEQSCHRVSKCKAGHWCPSSVCRQHTTTNLTPSCCGSSQNSCVLLHNDAWIKVTFLWAAFCHAAAILVGKSASPYLGSCPTEGQHEGQRDENAASQGRPEGLPGATGSPNLALCFLLTFQHPFLASLFPLVGELLPQHKHSGEDNKGREEISLLTWKSFSARDLKCRT